MQHSESIASIAAAFVKAQGAIETASKDAENPAFKRNGKATKYADLGAVWEACKVALQENDIGVVQAPGPYADGCASMTTMLLHKSGEWIKETMSIPTRGDAQGYGSSITYARRYALGAMLGVISEDDDDGNAATRTAKTDDKVSREQLDKLQDAATANQIDLLKFCAYAGVRSLKEIRAADFEQALAAMQKKAKKNGHAGAMQ